MIVCPACRSSLSETARRDSKAYRSVITLPAFIISLQPEQAKGKLVNRSRRKKSLSCACKEKLLCVKLFLPFSRPNAHFPALFFFHVMERFVHGQRLRNDFT